MSRARKVVAAIALLAGLCILAVSGWVAMNWTVVSTFPGMPSAYESKELCSCLWVEGRPEEDCLKFVAQSLIPIQGRDIDATTKTVTVQALWTSNRASWTGAPYGCVLQ
jgi:hypothetical protein